MKLTLQEKIALTQCYKIRKRFVGNVITIKEIGYSEVIKPISFVKYIPELQWRNNNKIVITASKKACSILRRRKIHRFLQKYKMKLKKLK